MRQSKALILCLAFVTLACAPQKGDRGETGQRGDAVVGPPGSAGQDGEDGVSPELPDYSIVGVIDPCGDAPGIIDEIFLVLKNGQIIAYFAENGNAQKSRLVLIPDGTYVTTDGSNCLFKVHNGQVSY